MSRICKTGRCQFASTRGPCSCIFEPLPFDACKHDVSAVNSDSSLQSMKRPDTNNLVNERAEPSSKDLVHQSCDQYLFWKLDFHANFQLTQYYTKTDFTRMEASLRGSASEPDKNLTDDWIDGPLISLLLLSKPGNAETL